jgi:hypothetical protein
MHDSSVKSTYADMGFTGNLSVGDSDVHRGGWLLKTAVYSSK